MTDVEHALLATLCLFISYIVGKYQGRLEGINNAVTWLIENDCIKEDKIETESDDE
jgi:hypothetical protein